MILNIKTLMKSLVLYCAIFAFNIHPQETPSTPTAISPGDEREASRREADLREKNQQMERDKALKIWHADSATVRNLLQNCRKYKFDRGLTEIQNNSRERLLEAEKKKMVSQFRGSELSFVALKIVEIREEKKLNSKGREKWEDRGFDWIYSEFGKLQVPKKLGGILDFSMATRARANIATCESCYSNTGRYVLELAVEIPDKSMGASTGVLLGREPEAKPEEQTIESGPQIMEVSIFKFIASEAEAMAFRKGKTIQLKGRITFIEYKSRASGESAKIFLE